MTDWPFRMKNIQHTGFSPDKLSLPLEIVWKHKIGEYIHASPTIVNGVVYEGTIGLRALDLKSGEVIWNSTEVNAVLWGYSAPIYYNHRLYLSGHRNFNIVDAETGELVSSLPYTALNASPICIENTLIFECLEKKCVAVDITTGKEIWSLPLQWMHYTPTASGDLVYVPDKRTIHALNWRTGELVWSHTFDTGEILDMAAIFREHLIVSVQENGVFSLNALTGEGKWKSSALFMPFTAPGIGEDTETVYVGGGVLHALKLENGQLIWTSKERSFHISAPVVIGDYIVVGGAYRRIIYLFDRASGKLVWSYPTKDLVYSTAAYSDGYIVIGSHDGFLYCFTSKKQEG